MSETKQTLTVNACTGRDLLITGSMLPTATLLLKASPGRDRWGPGAGRVETVMHSAHLTALLHQRGLFSATDAHRVSTCNTISAGNGSQFKSYSWDSIKSDSKCQASSVSNSLFPPSPFLPSIMPPSFLLFFLFSTTTLSLINERCHLKPLQGGLFIFSIYYLKICFHDLNVSLKMRFHDCS